MALNVNRVRNIIKDTVGYSLMVFVVAVFILLVVMKAISPNRFASVQKDAVIDGVLDSRCICICPHNLNITVHYNKTVFIRDVSDPSKCTCLETVPEATQLLCLQCDCSFESRNSVLIASIVVGTLLLAFCLMPPCAFVVCIQPWVKVKMLRSYASSRTYTAQYGGAMTRIRRRGYEPVVETPT